MGSSIGWAVGVSAMSSEGSEGQKVDRRVRMRLASTRRRQAWAHGQVAAGYDAFVRGRGHLGKYAERGLL